MHSRNIPVLGPRYWAGLWIASVLGVNMGDFVAHVLALGHANGVAPVLAAFGLVLLAERRSRAASGVYYWLAIIALRTAATNLADLLTHDLGLAHVSAMAGLGVGMAGLVVARRLCLKRDRAVHDPGLAVGGGVSWGFYWAAMLVAGTLGTVLADYAADGLGLGDGLSAAALCGVLGLIMVARAVWSVTTAWLYWLTLVAVAAAGTSVGDYAAGRHGLALGLPVSVVGSALLFAAVLMVSRRDGGRGATAA